MRARTFVVSVAATVLMGGCGGGDEPEVWAGPPRPGADGSVTVEAFNDHLDETDDAASLSPLEAAVAFLRLDRVEAVTTAVVVERGPEGGGDATVTATLDRIADDSIRAQRYELELIAGETGWRLRSARFAQRCWPGRGHQDFAPEPCV